MTTTADDDVSFDRANALYVQKYGGDLKEFTPEKHAFIDGYADGNKAARKLVADLTALMPNHRPRHDSTGGYRGILRGTNEACVCGAEWVSYDSSTPWGCPRERALKDAAAAL